MVLTDAERSADDRAVFHADDTAGFLGDRGVVGAGDDGDAELGAEVAQHADDGRARAVVEVGRRLVGEDQVGLLISERAMAVRCCSPPDILVGGGATRWPSPTSSSSSSARLRNALRS